MATKLPLLFRGKHDEITDPTRYDLERWMGELNNFSPASFHLLSSAGELSIVNVNESRVAVYFTNRKLHEDWRGGQLTDPEYSKADGVIDFESQPEVGEIEIHLTVPKEKALGVAIRFLEHGTFSSSTVWEGNMDGYLE